MLIEPLLPDDLKPVAPLIEGVVVFAIFNWYLGWVENREFRREIEENFGAPKPLRPGQLNSIANSSNRRIADTLPML